MGKLVVQISTYDYADCAMYNSKGSHSYYGNMYIHNETILTDDSKVC